LVLPADDRAELYRDDGYMHVNTRARDRDDHRPTRDWQDMAVALGVNAVENGISVALNWLENLLQALQQDTDLPPRLLRGRKYVKVCPC
jgi:hypothetical protein